MSNDQGLKELPKSNVVPLPKTRTAKTKDKILDEQPVPTDVQYTPSDRLQSDASFSSPTKGGFKRFFEYLQFNHGPAAPRSSAPVDLLLIFSCFAAVHFFRIGSLDFTTHRVVALFSALVFLVLALSAGGLYNTRQMHGLNRELRKLLICWICAFAAIGLFAFLTKTAGSVSRVWVTSSMVLTLAALCSVRVLGSFEFLTGNKSRIRNVIVCGDTTSTRSVIRNLFRMQNSRVRVARVFEFPTDQSYTVLSASRLHNAAQKMYDFVESQRQSGVAIEQVWIAVSSDQAKTVEELSEMLINTTVDVCVVPDFHTERLLKGDVVRFGETRVVNVSEISLSPASDRFKRVFDVVVASFAVIALCIPMAIIALLVKRESPGPALFRQKRYGVDGKEIEVLKFRSMKVHADSEVKQATRGDDRVTRIGNVLRSTSLDELPQLFNVLQGTMSLVGPRPHAAAHNELWRKQINGYMLRHKVRPGITGWAQVNGWRGETETHYKMQQRVKYDLQYIERWTPWLDVKIMFLTVATVLRGENAY